MCLTVLALAGCASTPPDQDPVQIKLNDLDTRVTRIERVVANQSLLELANQVEALRNDVRALHNDVDELSHNLELSRKQQRDLYADLDHRLKALEARSGPAGAAAAASAAPAAAAEAAAAAAAGGAAAASTAAAANRQSGLPVPDGTDTANYQAAFTLLKDSQYDRAIGAFQNFLTAFPDSPLAENAQYWLGEAYYVNKSFTGRLGGVSARGGQVPAVSQAARCAAQGRLLRLRAQAVGRREAGAVASGGELSRIRPPDTWRSSASIRWRPRSIEPRAVHAC